MRTQCISDLQPFESFRHCCFFCKFCLLGNLYSSDAHHPNYGKHSLNNHFKHCAHSIYQILSILQDFQISICFCTFFLWRNFCSGDARHANNGEHCWSPHFRYWTHCVDEIYSVFKVFEIAVVCARFCFFDIWTPLILTMLAIVNVVQIIISNIAHSVYMRFTVFPSFSKLLSVLNILAYSKFLLRRGASY